VCGYFADGDQVVCPIEIVCQVPFARAFGGGEFFVVTADADARPPLEGIRYGTGRSIGEDTQPRLRCPARVVSFSRSYLALDPAFVYDVLRRLFASISSLNGSFLVDNFAESVSDNSSGIDVSGVLQAYAFAMEKVPRIVGITRVFNELLTATATTPPSIQLPATKRFLMIGLLMPSVTDFRDGYDCWRNLVNVISQMNSFAVLTQWLSVIDRESLRGILDSLKALLTMELAHMPSSYGPDIVKTVQALEVVWRASTRSKKLPFDAFYHDAVNRMINIQTEVSFWVESNRPWCFARNAPWLLNAGTKTNFLRANSQVLMGQQLQHAAQHARHFLGLMPVLTPFEIYLILPVARESLLRDTFWAIAQLKNPDMELKKPLKICFKDEPAIDEGGVQREFFELIVNELFDPEKGFFVARKDFYWFNPDASDPASRQAFLLAGVVFGLAIYNGNLLNVRFPQALYKKLRGLKMSYEDLRDFDAQLFTTLENVLTYDGDVETDMGLTFEYLDIPLCPNGQNMTVTNANRRDYCDTLAQFLLVTSVAAQFNEFRTGFLQAAGSIVLDLFRPEELGLLIAGREELDFAALEAHTTYDDGYTPNSPSIRTFWKIVHTRLTDEEKRRLLYFATACPRAPINGLGAVPFRIGRDGEPTHIPTSHTCFFQLVLPDDPDEERMYRKLRIALENAEGFAFR
jgi:hypothetical protein